MDQTRAGRSIHYRLRAQPLQEVSRWLTPYERFRRQKLADLRDLLDQQAEGADDE